MGIVDLDLLSQILKNGQESWGESREEASSSNSNNGGERVVELAQPKVEEGLFIAQEQI